MNKEQAMVYDFHTIFQLTTGNKPEMPSEQDKVLRIELIEEELREFKKATNENDIVEIADAIGDLLYVVYGAAVTYGIDTEEIFEEIHKSNMTKIWSDGKVHKNDIGKVMKPSTYRPANLKPILDKQISLVFGWIKNLKYIKKLIDKDS